MGGLAELALEVGVGTSIHEAASQTVKEGIASCWSSCQCWRLPWHVASEGATRGEDAKLLAVPLTTAVGCGNCDVGREARQLVGCRCYGAS